MLSKMLVTILTISLAIMSAAAMPSQSSDDFSEQSGDFESAVNPFNVQIPNLNGKSNDDDITKAFANQQHRKHPENSSNNAQRPSTTMTKAKQRKADLNDDVNHFIDLVPKAEVKAKIEEYYRNDMDVQHIFEYMHGKEFLELRKHILETPDVKETLQYLNKNGLNVKSLIRKLDHRVGVSKLRSTIGVQLAYNPQPQFGKLSAHNQ